MSKIKRQQTAGANCSAMEQRPFQKRVQLKNHRSRGNISFKVVSILILSILFCIICAFAGIKYTYNFFTSGEQVETNNYYTQDTIDDYNEGEIIRKYYGAEACRIGAGFLRIFSNAGVSFVFTEGAYMITVCIDRENRIKMLWKIHENCPENSHPYFYDILSEYPNYQIVTVTENLQNVEKEILFYQKKGREHLRKLSY